MKIEECANKQLYFLRVRTQILYNLNGAWNFGSGKFWTKVVLHVSLHDPCGATRTVWSLIEVALGLVWGAMASMWNLGPWHTTLGPHMGRVRLYDPSC